MAAAAGISTTAAPPNAVVEIQPGMNVQPVVLVDQNGNYVSTDDSVLTTLGDTIYENATPAPARLAGNTTATKNFLTQTGTGSGSAAPAWGTIASGDMPTGTTSAKGALQLDGTASHILANGVQAAGSNGTPADSGHIHPYESFLSQYQVPTGATAETLPRGLATGISGAGNTGYLYVRGIGLPSGLPVNNITFVVSSTATTLADVTHGWYVLLDDNLVVRAVSVDQTSGNWGTINTPVTLSVAGSSYTTTYSGLYYVGQMVAISAGSMPTFLQGPSITAAAEALTPALQGLSSVAQTTPPLTGATMATITPVISANYYAYTS